MKLILVVFTSLLSLNLIAQTQPAPDTTTVNCFAVNGLNLRKHPSKNAAKILKIPFGASMKILSKSGRLEQIVGLEGEWIKVTFKSSIGYVFDAYTSEFPIPKLKKTGYSYLLEYMVKNFKRTGGDDLFDITEADRHIYKKNIQFEDINYTFDNEGHDAIETVQIPNANIQECFIVFTACTSIFRKYTLDHSKFKEVKNKTGLIEYKSYHLYHPENSGEGYIYSYRLNDLGHYILMEIEFEWETGGSWFKCKQLDNNSVEISHGYYAH